MHIPVLLEIVIEYLNPRPDENFVDCTIGEAGHAKAILEDTKPNGRVLGIDLDLQSLKRIKSKIVEHELGERLILTHGNFKDLKKIVKENHFKSINGILFDLGLSSWQIEKSKRGFSFKKDEALKMTFHGQDLTAIDIINSWPEQALTEIFKKYGEEKYSWKIAKGIIKERKIRPIKTTFQLLETIKKTVPYSKTRRGQISRVAARIFQALRITVNDELENLRQGLRQSLEILEPGGRLVVISFHSLEDRIVKNFFKQGKEDKFLEVLTKKPITAGEEEVKNNSRSRSAKLRAAFKL